MTAARNTWICACGAEFVGSGTLPPPDWQWHGSRLLCQDCAQPDLPPRRGRAQSTHPAVADVRLTDFDAATANLIRNGAARDIADPDNARIAA